MGVHIGKHFFYIFAMLWRAVPLVVCIFIGTIMQLSITLFQRKEPSVPFRSQ